MGICVRYSQEFEPRTYLLKLVAFQDKADGFIHFSSKDQIVESAAKHRKGQVGLMLISVDVDVLGDALRWEESGRQKLFPHLYGELPTDAVSKAEALPLGPDGFHVFPEF